VGKNPAFFNERSKNSNKEFEQDNRWTPDDLWEELKEQFNFTIDVAASEKNAKCERFYTIDDDGLARSWAGERVWCNPPYSKIRDWVAKAFHEWQNGTELIVMLIPSTRTEQPFWQEFIEPYRDRGLGITTRFVARRRKFFDEKRGFRSHATFGLVLVIFESTQQEEHHD
jgi:phage N-6-adenine-methyltransferase